MEYRKRRVQTNRPPLAVSTFGHTDTDGEGKTMNPWLDNGDYDG